MAGQSVRMSTLPHRSSTAIKAVLEAQVRTHRKEEEIKSIWVRKVETK
jgi:hypothetical protein